MANGKPSVWTWQQYSALTATDMLSEDVLCCIATELDWVAVALAARTCSAWRGAFAHLLSAVPLRLGGLSFQSLRLPSYEPALHSQAVKALLAHAEAALSSSKTERPMLGTVQDAIIYLFVVLRHALQAKRHATVVVSARVAELAVTSLLRMAKLSGCSGRITVVKMPLPESRGIGAKDALRPLFDSSCVPDVFLTRAVTLCRMSSFLLASSSFGRCLHSGAATTRDARKRRASR